MLVVLIVVAVLLLVVLVVVARRRRGPDPVDSFRRQIDALSPEARRPTIDRGRGGDAPDDEAGGGGDADDS